MKQRLLRTMPVAAGTAVGATLGVMALPRLMHPERYNAGGLELLLSCLLGFIVTFLASLTVALLIDWIKEKAKK